MIFNINLKVLPLTLIILLNIIDVKSEGCESASRLNCTWLDALNMDTFDGKRVNFFGSCKYDYVSTDCYNSSLPSGLVPFTLKQRSDGSRTHGNFLDYFELNFNGNEYVLIKGSQINVLKNGVQLPLNYSDSDIEWTWNSNVSRLFLSTSFGLYVEDGTRMQDAKISICDSYASHVCGICGNADGDSANDLVDRQNVPVPVVNAGYIGQFRYTSSHYLWGQQWKSLEGNENLIDRTGTLCTESNNITVANPLRYDSCSLRGSYARSYKQCGQIYNKANGPFSKCLRLLDADTISVWRDKCAQNMCQFEHDPALKEEAKCSSYSQMNDMCIKLGQSLNQTWQFNWRNGVWAQCPLTCNEPNEERVIMAKCPGKCTDPTGSGYCGIDADHKLEACGCSNGWLRDPDGRCVPETQCANYDPYERCNSWHKFTCQCSGDPHCTTFDKARHDFMGTCKYDLITTDCFNNALPSFLTPFNVKQRQDARGNTRGVSMVEYLELNVFGNEYRLLRHHEVTKNGVPMPKSYVDAAHGIQWSVQGLNMVLSTDFGLTISYDGDHRHVISLCDVYENNVCGLCGNADGLVSNDFVDRGNEIVAINGTGRWTKWYDWGTQWKSYDGEGLTDLDGSKCNDDVIVQLSPEIPCDEEAFFTSSQEWCGVLANTSGPWAECLSLMDSEVLGFLVESCAIDMCSTRNDSLQREFLCGTYQDFNAACLELGESLNQTWTFNWRDQTGCSLECGENQEFLVKESCSPTCVYPDGNYDCGLVGRIEGCFCKAPYVLDSEGECVEEDECGCPMPDGSSYLQVGKTIVSDDCSKVYACASTQGTPTVTTHNACSINGHCQILNETTPSCVCNENYEGDGHVCEPACNTNFCYGYGDPHYRSQYGVSLKINNTCSYVLATDNCDLNSSSTAIFVDHENRYGYASNSYMKAIRIKYAGKTLKIEKQFYVNGIVTQLPYNGGSFSVNKEGFYTVVNTPEFNLYFDGEMLLKVSLCQTFAECGLCKLQNDDSFPYSDQLDASTLCDQL